MNVILYTIDCPKCKVLEMYLKKAGIDYSVVKDLDIMKEKGFKEAPQLEVDGIVYKFTDALTWVKNFSK